MRYPLYLLLLFFVLFAVNAVAQENDTVMVQAPVADTTMVVEDEDYEESADDTKTYDTTLLFQQWYYPNDSINHLRRQKDFSYTNNLDSLLKIRQDELNKQQKEITESTSTTTSVDIGGIFQVLLWGIIIAAVLFVLYRVFLSDKGLFTSPTKNKSVEIEEEQLTDEAYIDQQLKQAVQEQNYRLAIRYLYLQTLNGLSQRNWLHLSPDKTNYQYVRELAKPQLRNAFSRVTLHYEYAWYGDFAIDAMVYQQVKNDFDLFNQSVKQL
ncbi:uncharacterized protein DUF4129 [Lacibacter cauensis]|uniref:Uncharacterized protein DUF4129 n=1 Tax=Lacibacter cauensis TaxID=510947 RepID=A0A562SXL4_9BACT|nr:DUF4129 domain-containing protein [Lacibacter cauensis]TWI85470.1 uncharacterized protein DUF4129 [Lacibacter cauensis]